MTQTVAARKWHTWRCIAHLGRHAGGNHDTCVPRKWRTRGANWGSTVVAQMEHVCSTQVAHTWRKLGQYARMWNTRCKLERHAGGTNGTWRLVAQHACGTHGPCVCHAGGTHVVQTWAARMWSTGRTLWQHTSAQVAHVCATQVAHARGKLGQHAGGATGACVRHAGGTNMAQTKAARRWHAHGAHGGSTQVPQIYHTYVCMSRPCVCRAGGTHMGQTGAARRWCK